MERRSFLRLALAGVAGATVGVPLSACGARSPSDARPDPAGGPRHARGGPGRILLAYFSRAGENYYYGGRRNLRVGNTEVLARMISARLDCDVHRIEAVDRYSADYEETVERNVREQQANARPAIATPLASIDPYDTILLASPIWNVRAPMIMTTFAESYAFSGKTVLPITTYAMSGLGTTPDDYAQWCRGARIGTGLAVRGEEVRSAGTAVDSWLRRTGLLDGRVSARRRPAVAAVTADGGPSGPAHWTVASPGAARRARGRQATR
jgi:flavodoxin